MRTLFRCLVIAACALATDARAQCAPPGLPAVLDVNRITSGSSVSGFTDLGDGRALFVVPGAGGAAELWVTDGTEAGTTWLVTPLDASSTITVKRAGAANRAVFVARNAMEWGIWVTDGTASGTQRRLRRTMPGFVLRQWAATDDAVYFTQSDTGWPAMQRMDLVTGMSLGVYGGIVKAMAPFGAGVLLSGDDGVNGSELWYVDTSATLLADVNPGPDGSDPSDFTTVGGRAFFLATTAVEGREPWVTDGTASGTTLVRDVEPGVASSRATSLVDAGGWLGFLASTASGWMQPWRSDGTPAGTALIAPVSVANDGITRAPRLAAWQGGLAYFVAEPGGLALHVSDGSTDTSVAVVEVAFVPSDQEAAGLAAVGNGVMFRASNPWTSCDPWFSDGTAAGTARLADTLPDAFRQTVHPRAFTTFGSLGLFIAQDRTAGDEPWITDGTPSGTRRIADVDRRSVSSGARSFVSAPGPLFVADDGLSGREVYSADLATATFSQVVDLAPGGTSGVSSALMPVVGAALFIGPGTTSGLWRTDGTAVGTQLVSELPGSAYGVGAAAGRAYFHVSGELWASDGAGGTTSLGIPWAWSTAGRVLPFLSRAILLTGSTAWISDGTAGGTALLADVSPATIADAATWSDQVALLVSDTQDTTLWTSRGAPGDAAPSSLLGNLPLTDLTDIEECGGRLFLSARGGSRSGKLWYTDGVVPFREVPGSDAAGAPAALLGAAGPYLAGMIDPWPAGARVLLVDASRASPSARIVDVGMEPDRFVGGAASWLVLGADPADWRRRLSLLLHADGSFRSVPLAPLADAEAAHVDGRFVVVADDGLVGAEPWIVEDDADGDGLADSCDPCPALAASAGDLDGDLADEACDTCPGLADPLQADADHDGVGDACDTCPLVGDPTAGDLDGDGFGNACDPDADADGYPGDPASPSPDCNDLDPLAGTLREVSDLRVGWDGSQIVLTWGDESAFAGPGVTYDVLGGAFAGLMDETMLVWTGECIALRVPQATVSFPRTGNAWFVVRAFVAGCAPGPVGLTGSPAASAVLTEGCP